ncbi:pilus assembly FimT family protein [Pseudaquabacterium rugosum]|uniref:GspH/FimT family pseudopilin n=1 Tax=Pseudaquabacterium rugosum TaxID=2984194 RepID=A0ABU9BFK1_9BURK
MEPNTAIRCRAVGALDRHGKKAARGLGSIEIYASLCCSALLVSQALPRIDAIRDRQAVQVVAGELDQQLRMARQTAIALDTPVRLTLRALTGGGGHCTLTHTGDPQACRCADPTTGAPAACDAPARLLQASSTRLAEAGATVTTVNRTLIFAPDHGTVTPTATFEIRSRQGLRVRKIINILGRVRGCAVTPLPGWSTCA